MPTEELYRIAVLIDAENVDPVYAEQIFSYAHSLGYVAIREIYGSGTSLNEWADPILTNSIHTNFTLRPNRFKNSSDICLVIGAMEILAASRTRGAEKIAAIVIASSDSDFSPLAVHLRSENIDVIGMGEPGHINPMWPKSCTDFIPLETGKPLTRNREAATAAASAPMPAVTPAAASAPMPAATPAAASAPMPAATPAAASAPPPSLPAAPSDQAPSPAADAPAPGAVSAKAETQDGEAQEAPSEPKTVKPEKEKKERKKAVVAPNHRARVDIIRSFTADQIEKRGGRISSRDLFRKLAALPDYKYDQKRSRRNPLDYLKTQYSEWFCFDPEKDGAAWITVKAAAEPGAEPAPGTETGTETGADAAPGTEADAQTSRLAAAGIPGQHIAQVAEILSTCRNLRDSYNRLRKVFGNETGKKYQEFIKNGGISLGK